MRYSALVLTQQSRNHLKSIFPPKYPDFIGHHVTLKFGVDRKELPAPLPDRVSVVGYVDDGEGLEALLVALNGNTDRPDGSKYHITWSLDRSLGKKPVDSNAIIGNAKKTVDVKVDVTSEILG
jgi:hypothetical protein